MELLPFEQALTGRTVFLTGHTGFTGGWAVAWLHSIGARVCGFAMPPSTEPSLFDKAGIGDYCEGVYGDVRRFDALLEAMRQSDPDLVLHLAAQPLVRRSYREPLETFDINAGGTANVLEAVRRIDGVQGVLCITTDKVYDNREWEWAYRENDPLGGGDPYSASKAAAELVIDGYRNAFASDGRPTHIATARGGNIIGGGDWSEDRLLPDIVKAVIGEKSLQLRYPHATRPWQHVLGLVQGYMMIMAGMLSNRGTDMARAWNLGPSGEKSHSVAEIVEMTGRYWQKPDVTFMQAPAKESLALALDSSLARNLLGWRVPWSVEDTVRETIAWYREYYSNPANARQITLEQIRSWRESLAQFLKAGAAG